MRNGSIQKESGVRFQEADASRELIADGETAKIGMIPRRQFLMGKPKIFLPDEKVEVLSYSGYRGEEMPRFFKWRGTRVEVGEIRGSWIEEGVGDRRTKRKFRLMGTDGIPYCLIYDEQTQEWFCESKGEEP